MTSSHEAGPITFRTIRLKSHASLSGIRCGTALAIGKFDGVHTGHQFLVGALAELAKARGLEAGAILFDPSPNEVLRPDTVSRPLMTVEDRVERLLALDLDFVVVMAFSRKLASLTAADFLKLLHEHFEAELFVMGPRNTIGKDQLDAKSAASLSDATCVDVAEVRPWTLTPMDTLSATAIRTAIQGGRVREATDNLGRPHRIPGVADTIGAPSGNRMEEGASYLRLRVDNQVARPPAGDYSGWITVGGVSHLARIRIDETGLTQAAAFGLGGDLAEQEVSVGFIEESAIDAPF